MCDHTNAIFTKMLVKVFQTTQWKFLFCAKIIIIVIIIWIVTSLMREADYVYKLNELYHGSDFPSYASSGDDEILELIDVSQSLELPLQQDLRFSISEGIRSGDIVPNCGLTHLCASNEFAIHLFTGKDNTQYPRLCIDGKYILDRGLNSCGRGINAVVIDNITRSILRVSNFDTYEKDSTALETLLLTLRYGDIIVLLTFDESTSKLSHVAKLLLHEMGSSMAQNLYYRSSWYLITQKGIKGYSPYENIHLANSGGWAESHELKTCIPLHFNGIMVKPDPIIKGDEKRNRFCSKYSNDYYLFCEGNVINDRLIPSHFIRSLPISNEIIRTPIIVLSGHKQYENWYLPLTLETIVRQSGIKPRNVIVYYNPKCCSSVASLADVFEFMSNEFTESDDNNYLEESLRTTEMLFPDANAFILIDAGVNVILSPDFMSFMGQLLRPLLYENSEIIAVSSWNDNGYEKLLGDPTLVHRANVTNYNPRFASMFKRGFSFGDNALWSFTNSKFKSNDYILIPDVSRVLYTPDIGQIESLEIKNFILDFMQRTRSVNIEDEVRVKVDSVFTTEAYKLLIKHMIEMSNVIDDPNLLDVNNEKVNGKNDIYSLYCYDEIQCQDMCSHLGLTNCLPHIIIKDTGAIIRFFKGPNKICFIIKKNI